MVLAIWRVMARCNGYVCHMSFRSMSVFRPRACEFVFALFREDFFLPNSVRSSSYA